MMFLWGNGYLDEKQRQQGEDSGLNESDEQLEQHERHGQGDRQECQQHQNEHLSRKHIAEQPERKRDQTRDLTDQFYQTYEKIQGSGKIEEFLQIGESQSPNAGNFSHNNGNDRKSDGNVQIGVNRA